MNRTDLRNIMLEAWGFVRRNGFSLSEALKCAWANFKLRVKMLTGIVKFYYQKVDGSIREAWGTLSDSIIPPMQGCNRKSNPTVRNYFDTEKQDWRCYKKANLITNINL